MGVSTVKAVGGFEEGNDAFHACQSFVAGDVAAVDTCQYGHDAETAAAGCYYILIVFGVYTVHMDTFAGKPAVRFGSVPKVIEGSALHRIQQGIVTQRFGCAVGFLCTASSCKE